MGGLTNVGRRLTPVGYADTIRKKFIEPGNGSADAVDRFMAIQVIIAGARHPDHLVLLLLQPGRARRA